jgi:hypothetical protein
MLPVLVCESSTCRFQFYFNGSIHSGMVCRGTLYKLVRVFDVSDRLHAYTFGCKLSKESSDVLITVSECKQFYRVWVELRTKLAAQLLVSEPGCIEINESQSLLLAESI